MSSTHKLVFKNGLSLELANSTNDISLHLRNHRGETLLTTALRPNEAENLREVLVLLQNERRRG